LSEAKPRFAKSPTSKRGFRLKEAAEARVAAARDAMRELDALRRGWPTSKTVALGRRNG